MPQKEKPGAVTAQPSGSLAHQKLIVRLDRKGRGGKSVTIIDGLPVSDREKEVLLKQLKTRFGTGGALKDGALEIQGDHCAAILQHLQGMGYRPKRSGG